MASLLAIVSTVRPSHRLTTIIESMIVDMTRTVFALPVVVPIKRMAPAKAENIASFWEKIAMCHSFQP